MDTHVAQLSGQLAADLRINNPCQWVRLCQALDHRLPANLHDCSVVLARTGDQHFTKRLGRIGHGRLKAALAYAMGHSEQRTPTYTRSGEPILLDYPQATTIVDADFLALQHIERFGSARSVSVAQHLINCVAIALLTDIPWRPVFAHDLPELYVGEIPMGFKPMFGNFDRCEDEWLKHVHQHYGIRTDEHVTNDVRTCDMLALGYEVLTENHPAWRDILDDIGIAIRPDVNSATLSFRTVSVEVESVKRKAYNVDFSCLLENFCAMTNTEGGA